MTGPAVMLQGRLAALAAQARGQAGLPQSGVMPHTGPQAGPNAVLAQLRAGQMSAEHLMQIIAMLSGMGGIGSEGGAATGAAPSPIEAAYQGA